MWSIVPGLAGAQTVEVGKVSNLDDVIRLLILDPAGNPFNTVFRLAGAVVVIANGANLDCLSTGRNVLGERERIFSVRCPTCLCRLRGSWPGLQCLPETPSAAAAFLYEPN